MSARTSKQENRRAQMKSFLVELFMIILFSFFFVTVWNQKKKKSQSNLDNSSLQDSSAEFSLGMRDSYYNQMLEKLLRWSSHLLSVYNVLAIVINRLYSVSHLIFPRNLWGHACIGSKLSYKWRETQNDSGLNKVEVFFSVT